MTKTNRTIPIDLASVDWRGVTSALLSDLATRLLVGLRDYAESCGPAARAEAVDPVDATWDAVAEDLDDNDELDDGDEPARDAAALLGVSLDATADEVRAALRSKLATSRLHPDHGGSGEEATRLITARNLLVERACEARA